jgi:hypothetical protein
MKEANSFTNSLNWFPLNTNQCTFIAYGITKKNLLTCFVLNKQTNDLYSLNISAQNKKEPLVINNTLSNCLDIAIDFLNEN